MDFSSYFPIWNKLTPTQQQILERNAVLRKVDKGTVIHNGTVECTYVGSSQAGFLGAVLATLAVVLPSFFVILLVMNLLGSILKSRYAQAVLQGLKPCMIGIILATGLYMTLHNCFPLVQGANVDFRALLMTAVLTACIPIYRYLEKEKPSPILLIIASAVLGIIIY